MHVKWCTKGCNLFVQMSEKCAFARFLVKKCQREEKECNVEKRILEQCIDGKLYYMGCSKEYKPRREHLKSTRKVESHRVNLGKS